MLEGNSQAEDATTTDRVSPMGLATIASSLTSSQRRLAAASRQVLTLAAGTDHREILTGYSFDIAQEGRSAKDFPTSDLIKLLIEDEVAADGPFTQPR
ncbi:hypothetical protein CORC01_05582 [Colletotrichum orchidophilum]|uniref:Uncharacterized protein n=1 Tax=Colletotrichum orchidophilum TaxID=1209926 RepID=A0A1G4BCE2_9PEZI|nr:uncharacterized protein CORC01_05582 [Colletotrichum orchidophilum]OHE99089.1 hypothetical protein CORC01_05582 [Colletotrichum orchidophilum]